MADYYTEASISIGNNDTMDGEPATKIDKVWFQEFMEIVNDDNYVYEDFPENVADWPKAEADALRENCQKLTEEDIIKAVQLASDDDYCSRRFNVEVEDDGSVYLFNSEDANVDLLEEIVQYTLQKHDSNEIVPIAWAAYCSRPITGEQGGGATVVTKDSSEYITTFGWISEKTHELKQAFKKTQGIK